MVHAEQISFGNNLPGYYVNKSASKKSAVIVIQEWWGITEELKRQAQYVSDKTGYQTFLPDLYKGKIGVDAEEAHHLMDNLDFEAATEEIKQAVSHVKENGADKVGVVGFCMGGALSLLAAEHAGVDVAVSFYGTPGIGHPEKIKVPCQGHAGSDDSFKGFADPATVKGFLDKINGPATEFYEYQGQGHGFMNSDRKDIREKMDTGDLPVGSKEAQEQAWSRSIKFLTQYLD